MGAAWQVDLFGRVRRQTEAAQALVYASEQGQRGVVLTVVSGVATSYIVLRSLDRQLEIAQATTRNFEGTLRIFERRFKAGLVGNTEVTQIRSQLQQARAAIPAFEQAIAAQENLISILLAATRARSRAASRSTSWRRRRFRATCPPRYCKRRPDILQAEQNLVAANANIVRRARSTTRTCRSALPWPPLAPRQRPVQRSGGGGLIGASLTGPIFTFGAIEGQVFSRRRVNERLSPSTSRPC